MTQFYALFLHLFMHYRYSKGGGGNGTVPPPPKYAPADHQLLYINVTQKIALLTRQYGRVAE